VKKEAGLGRGDKMGKIEAGLSRGGKIWKRRQGWEEETGCRREGRV
jgi:hypothetical protein